MASTNFAQLRALVTGGASGIGLASVRMLAEAGAFVAVNHLPDDTAAAATVAMFRERGLRVEAVPGDVGDVSSAEKMVGTAIECLGGLDLLVNNAGRPATPQPIPFHDLDAMTEELWEKVFSVNLMGTFRCSKAAASALRASRGAIVNVASVAGLGTRGSSIAYAASKAAVVNLTRNLARALAPDVRVNAVAPGLIETPWTEGWSDERKQDTLKSILLGRLGSADEVAQAIVFLGTSAHYINGEILVINGGSA